MKVIIFICTSNVCRSPAAAALAKKWLLDHNREEIEVLSRSLSTEYEPENSPPSAHSKDIISSEFNVDISAHRSALLTAEDVERADVIVGITKRHAWVVAAEFPAGNTTLIYPTSHK